MGIQAHITVSGASTREELVREIESVLKCIVKGEDRGHYAKMTSSISAEFTVVSVDAPLVKERTSFSSLFTAPVRGQ
jgi:hypothetical protein